MISMTPTIAITGALLPLLAEACGASVAVDKIAVTVDMPAVSVVADRMAVGCLIVDVGESCFPVVADWVADGRMTVSVCIDFVAVIVEVLV
jgi:hypothetical protein